MSWYNPKTWLTGESLTAQLLNEYLSENTAYLFERPHNIVTIRDGASDIAIPNLSTVGTFAEVDDDQFTLTIETTGTMLEVWFTATVRSSASGAPLSFDVWLDNEKYLSSFAGTPLDYGLVRGELFANYDTNMQFRVVFEDIDAGVHTLQLHYSAVSHNGTMLLPDHFVQFGVREV